MSETPPIEPVPPEAALPGMHWRCQVNGTTVYAATRSATRRLAERYQANQRAGFGCGDWVRRGRPEWDEEKP